MAGCGGDHGSTKDGSHVTVRLHYYWPSSSTGPDMFEQRSPSPGSIIFSSGRMVSGHVDFSLEDISEEQESIDKLIDSLLSLNPVSTSASS